MKVAHNQMKDIIYAVLVTKEQEKLPYFCPICSKKVYFKKNKKGTGYFSHHAKRSDFQTESEEHKEAKQLLAKWLKKELPQADVWMEKGLAYHTQRMDVFVQFSGMKWVFEIQCSPLSIDEFMQRRRGYKQAGIQDIWIFGKYYLHKITLNEVLLASMRYSSKWGWHVLFFEKKKLILYHHISLPYANHKMNYQFKTYSLKDATFLQMKEWLIEEYRLASLNESHVVSQIMPKLKEKMKRKNDKEHLLLMNCLYENRMSISCLPESVFYTPYYSFAFKSPNYVWRSYLWIWIEQIPSGESIDLMDAMNEIERLVNDKVIRLNQLSNTSVLLRYSIIFWFKQLSKENLIIGPIATNCWIKG